MARRKIGDEKDSFAHQLLWLIPLGNATQDGSVLAAAVVESELQEFLALLYLLATLDKTYTYVELLEVLKRNRRLHWRSLVGSRLVLLHNVLELLLLRSHNLVFYLGEQQLGLWQLPARSHNVSAAKVFP